MTVSKTPNDLKSLTETNNDLAVTKTTNTTIAAGTTSSSMDSSFEFPPFHTCTTGNGGNTGVGMTGMTGMTSTTADLHNNTPGNNNSRGGGGEEPPEDLNVFVSDLLEQMQNKFQIMGKTIINRIDDLGSRIDELEQSVSTLAEQSDSSIYTENQKAIFGGNMKIPRSPVKRNIGTSNKEQQQQHQQQQQQQQQQEETGGFEGGLDDYKFETNFDPFDTVDTVGGDGVGGGSSSMNGTTISDSPIRTIQEDQQS